MRLTESGILRSGLRVRRLADRGLPVPRRPATESARRAPRQQHKAAARGWRAVLAQDPTVLCERRVGSLRVVCCGNFAEVTTSLSFKGPEPRAPAPTSGSPASPAPARFSGLRAPQTKLAKIRATATGAVRGLSEAGTSMLLFGGGYGACFESPTERIA
jgi:hypothetical protein